MFNPRAFKKQQAAYWDEAADELERGYVAMLGPVIERVLDAAQVGAGSRVLDLACGSGFATFFAGRRVGPTGSAVGVDIAPKMVATAQETTRRRDLTNVRFETGDAERLALPDQSFDAVICQLGIALFPNALGALAECVRVLEPGGRVVVTAIGRPESSGFLVLPARVAARHLPTVVVNDGGPNQLAYAAEGALDDLLRRGGLVNVSSRRVVVMVSARDAETMWHLFRRSVGGFAWRLAREREADRERVVDAIKRAYEERASGGAIRLPLEIVIGVGSRPHDAASARALPPLERIAARARVRTHGSLDDARRAGALLLDVRQAEESAADPIDGAIAIPRGVLERDVQARVPDRKTAIACFASGALRAALASESLQALGYENVTWVSRDETQRGTTTSHDETQR